MKYEIKWLGALLLILIPGISSGHPLDLGYLTVNVDGNHVFASLELNPKAAEGFLRASRKSDLMAATLGAAPIRSNGRDCRWTQSHVVHVGEAQTRLSAEAECPATGNALELSLPFLAKAQASYQLLGRIRFAGQEKTFLAEPTHAALTLNFDRAPSLLQFVEMGIRHIGAAPGEWKGVNGFHLPDGIDHILFLFGLILGGGVGGGLWCTLRTATGFTLGHSITLALAALGWVRPPGRWVESAIALSIAYIALEILILRRPRRRFELAVFFGLIHGFGFASALEELQLRPTDLLQALLGFNLGVEAGQVLIVVALLPLVLLMHSKPRLSRYGVPAFATTIALIGSYWFIERAMGY